MYRGGTDPTLGLFVSPLTPSHTTPDTTSLTSQSSLNICPRVGSETPNSLQEGPPPSPRRFVYFFLIEFSVPLSVISRLIVAPQSSSLTKYHSLWDSSFFLFSWLLKDTQGTGLVKVISLPLSSVERPLSLHYSSLLYSYLGQLWTSNEEITTIPTFGSVHITESRKTVESRPRNFYSFIVRRTSYKEIQVL